VSGFTVKLALIVAAGALLAACAFDSAPQPQNQQVDALPSLGQIQEIDAPPVRRAITGSCGMESVEHFVGQPRLSIRAALLPQNYRVLDLRTRQAPDYRPDRLTIRIDENDVVESMSCG